MTKGLYLMKKERPCKRCSIQFQPTGSFSSPALFGLLVSSSLSLISVGRKCNAYYSSWLPSPCDDERPIALLVGHVRLRPSRVLALCKNSFRGQSPSPPQLDNVRPIHTRVGYIRWTVFDRMGTRIAPESRLGRSIVSYSRRHSNPSSAATTTLLVSYSYSSRASERVA
jgi:hypothetical protein